MRARKRGRQGQGARTLTLSRITSGPCTARTVLYSAPQTTHTNHGPNTLSMSLSTKCAELFGRGRERRRRHVVEVTKLTELRGNHPAPQSHTPRIPLHPKGPQHHLNTPRNCDIPATHATATRCRCSIYKEGKQAARADQGGIPTGSDRDEA